MLQDHDVIQIDHRADCFYDAVPGPLAFRGSVTLVIVRTVSPKVDPTAVNRMLVPRGLEWYPQTGRSGNLPSVEVAMVSAAGDISILKEVVAIKRHDGVTHGHQGKNLALERSSLVVAYQPQSVSTGHHSVRI